MYFYLKKLSLTSHHKMFLCRKFYFELIIMLVNVFLYSRTMTPYIYLRTYKGSYNLYIPLHANSNKLI